MTAQFHVGSGTTNPGKRKFENLVASPPQFAATSIDFRNSTFNQTATSFGSRK